MTEKKKKSALEDLLVRFAPSQEQGFNILKNTIRKMTSLSGEQIIGLENMEPKSAQRERFLKEPMRREQRVVLKKRLLLWREQLDGSAKPEKLVAGAMKRSEELSALRKKNLKAALDASRDLEKSWRTLAAFFTNAEKTKGAKVENIDFLNVTLEQLKDKDNPLFLEKIAEELEANYDRLDLRDNYSLLIIPGFLGSVQNIDRVAEVAARNKVMLITDFEDVGNVEDALDQIDFHNLTSADEHKAYVCLLCNYLVGRPGYEDLDEPVMYLPPSTAVGGGIYANPTQITTAGVSHGRLKEVDGVKFEIGKAALGEIESRGVIPVTFQFGKAFTMADCSLFAGDNPGRRKYAVVRTFDYVLKTTMDLLNRLTFRNIDADLTTDIRRQINRFLDSNKGTGKLIANYEIISLTRDPNQVDKLRLEFRITPHFSVKVFDIALIGREGEKGEKEWDVDIA